MAWQTPKTNWQAGDVPVKDDFNRIEGNTQELQADLTSHTGATSAHSATSAATANRIMMRDSAGRAKVAKPVAGDDVARKDTVDVVQSDLDAHKAEKAIHKTSNVIRTETNTKLKVEVVSSSVSETPDAGRIIFDTSQGKFFGGNGTEWV